MYKGAIISSIEKKYCKKLRKNIIIVVVKKKLLNIICQKKNLSEKEKEAKRQYSRDRYKKIKEKLGGKL